MTASKGFVMSLFQGLAYVLHDMTLGELALALAAILAYSLAINASYGGGLRSGAASAAFAASVGFTTLSPGWMSAVVFLALAVAAVAAFAGLAWLLSSLLGLGESGETVPVDEEEAVVPTAAQPMRGFAPHTSAQPL
jgi:hypothetical protein